MHAFRITAQTALIIGVAAVIVPVMIAAVAVGSRLSREPVPHVSLDDY